MVFGAHRQALVGGVETRPFGDGPAQENAVQLEPEIIVQPRGVMLLDKIGEFILARLDGTRGRLRRLPEIPFASVFLESHIIRRKIAALDQSNIKARLRYQEAKVGP